VIKINALEMAIRNKDGAAAASSKSCEAKIYAVVAKVSKLKGLIIRVIGNSFIISIEIKIPIKNMEFFKYGKCIFVNVLNFE
tara:strand:+ start:903 stop:1148 length:246 start_codon:yes stop_codon:yes gene_type:complete